MEGGAGVLLLGAIGLAVGSFLNVCIDRLPAGQSLLSPPSHCPVCQARLRAADLVPVFSYLALRGKCRYCAAPIPRRLFLVEVATGVLFALTWARYGPSFEGIALLVYLSLFLVVFVTDLERGVIPNRMVFPGLLAALALASFWPGIGWARAVLGGAAGFGILLAIYLVSGKGIGAGDVKLAALVGAATGFPLVFLALAVAFLTGGIAAVALLISGRLKRRDRMPFGPFLAPAALASLLWGGPVLRWYLSYFWPL